MTSLSEIKEFNDQYFHWLKDHTAMRSLDGGWAEITTPFLDRHNDFLQIYAKVENDIVHLTDDGYVMSDLHMSGCSIESPKRQAVLKEILAGFDVTLLDERLEVMGDKRKFSQLKLNLIQAMLAVDDMFYLSSSHVLNLFSEDTASWLASSGVRYNPNMLVRGRSGFVYKYFGVIPRSEHLPERFIQPINRLDKRTVQQLIFEWDDTKDMRVGDPLFIPILNDTEKEIRSDLVKAFEAYNIKCIPWSERNKHVELLV